MSTIASSNQNLKSVNIKTAFVQSENLNHDEYLKPLPEEHGNIDQIWKLNECVYGLIVAALVWC